MKTWVTLALFGAVCLSAPVGAQQPQTASEAEKAKLDQMQMEFINTEGAIWVNRSINDTVYWSGYSPNSVFSERDAARVEAQMQRITANWRNKVDDLTVAPSSQTKQYQININGKVVPVEAQP